MRSAPSDRERDDPFPPRYWWLKRIAALCILTLVVLTILRFRWGRTAAARLDAAVAEISARGEKILLADFELPHVNDDENAVTYLTQATDSLNESPECPRSSNMEYYGSLPLPDEWYVMARKAIAANQKTLKLAHEARLRSKVDWHIDLKPPTISIMLPMLNSQRSLANLLADAAFYEHLQGNDDAALDHLLDLFRAADAVDQQPFLISHLVSIGVNALGIYQLQIISPGLKLENESQRAQVRRLIEVMLERTRGERTLVAIQGERMMMLDQSQWMTQNSVLLRPMHQLDTAELIGIQSEWLTAATQPSLSGATKIPPGARRAQQRRDIGYASAVSGMFASSLGRFIETDFRVRMDAAMTAVCLAARMYQKDHDGQWPADLNALVPMYLPSVPMDPMSSDGTPLKYIILNNGTRPIVYSVGTDGADDTKDQGLIPSSRPKYGWEQTADQWRDVSRVLGPPPASQPQAE